MFQGAPFVTLWALVYELDGWAESFVDMVLGPSSEAGTTIETEKTPSSQATEGPLHPGRCSGNDDDDGSTYPADEVIRQAKWSGSTFVVDEELADGDTE